MTSSQPRVVDYYEIVVTLLDGHPAVKLRYSTDGVFMFESPRYVPAEANRVVMMWRSGSLVGPFGENTILSPTALFQICTL